VRCTLRKLRSYVKRHESALEEQLLNFGWGESIAKYRCKMGLVEYTSRRAASDVLCISLRVRQYVLPCFASVATSAVIRNDQLSTQNLLFNILSVALVLNIDNELTWLLLPSEVHSLMDELTVKAEASQIVFNDPFIWTRALGVGVSSAMVLLIWIFQDLLNSDLFQTVKNDCNGIGNLLFQWGLYMLLIVISVHFLGYLKVRKIKCGLLQILFDVCAACVGFVSMLSLTIGYDLDGIIKTYIGVEIFGKYKALQIVCASVFIFFVGFTIIQSYFLYKSNSNRRLSFMV